MAIKGLRGPRVAKYDYNSATNTVTYSDGVRLGPAVEYSVSANISEDIILYGDDFPVEIAKGSFIDGELSLTTTHLTDEASLLIFGLKSASLGSAPVLVFDDDQRSPDLGFGIVETHQVNGVDKYVPVILTRVFFKLPDGAATTMGESISWQTPEITATVMRSELASPATGMHPWKYVKSTGFPTEAEAYAWLDSILIPAVP